MTTAVIAACGSVLVAVIAYILNQRGLIQQERRQALLARVSSQISELYGPLNAMVDINERIWEALRDFELPSQPHRSPEAGSESWRMWRDSALMPANRRMRDLIMQHADLLTGAEVPQAVRDFCAHVTSAEIAISAEKNGIRERSLIPHPGTVYVEYVQGTFIELKQEQQRLVQAMSTSIDLTMKRGGPEKL